MLLETVKSLNTVATNSINSSLFPECRVARIFTLRLRTTKFNLSILLKNQMVKPTLLLNSRKIRPYLKDSYGGKVNDQGTKKKFLFTTKRSLPTKLLKSYQEN